MKRFLIRLCYILGVCLSIFIVAIVFINLTIDSTAQPFLIKNITTSPNAQVIIIPGAAVFPDGTLSPILQDRALAAIALYESNKASKILVSGDNSALNHNEVTPVQHYLITHGIPSKDIFLDHAGFDTYSTMYRARDIFGVSSALIVSQSFHLPRALFIAHALGITAYGVIASDSHNNLWNFIREIFADEKALFDVITHRTPEYLGPSIPITGDSTQNP